MIIVLICDCYIQLSMNYFSSMVTIDPKAIIFNKKDKNSVFKQIRQYQAGKGIMIILVYLSVFGQGLLHLLSIYFPFVYKWKYWNVLVDFLYIWHCFSIKVCLMMFCIFKSLFMYNMLNEIHVWFYHLHFYRGNIKNPKQLLIALIGHFHISVIYFIYIVIF